MGYEKKYKEALEKAEKNYRTAQDLCEGSQIDVECFKNTLTNIFPELKESEDERIRKALIKEFNECLVSSSHYPKDAIKYWHGIVIDDILAWLEKQGEERKITHEEICKSYGIPDIGEFSDGYHTFNGLYKQRMILFAVLVKTYKDRAWKSWKHEDGLDCFGGGWFIVGIDTPAGTYTYHYEAKDWDRFDCQILEKAKHWDGHDEFDVERLFSLVSNANKDEVIRCLINGMKFYYEDNEEATWGTEKFSMKVKDILSWLEKQGGIDNCPLEYSTNTVMTDSKKNQVKPKFKVGDWVVDKNGTVQQILSYKNDIYKHTNGYSSKMFEDEWRLWDITKDAKCGDILQANKCTLIVDSLTKDVDGNTVISSWYFCDSKKFYGMGTSKPDLWDIEGITPATKEQRDILFQKMKEAGYTFDFESKKLKKIEDEEYDGEDYGIDGLWHAQRILEKTLGEVDGYQTDDGILDHKAAITAVKKLYGQKSSTWSEEDEQMLNSIIEDFGDGKTSNMLQEYWLKSLKERIGG